MSVKYSTTPSGTVTGRLAGKASLIIGTILIAGLLVAPYVFYPAFLMKALCFALFACAFNLMLGFVGLLSFGHAAFFGAAAYATGFAAKEWGFTPELAILFGGLVGGAFGLLFGWIAIRRQGIYFAMITLALSQMVFFFALQATAVTGGEDGLQGVPRGAVFGLISLEGSLPMYYFVVAVFLLCFFLIWRIVNSPFGAVLKSIRENEPRAISLGYRVDRFKLIAFGLSAALTGVAGGTKTIALQLASLTDIQWQMSGEVILMTLLGGVGTLVGPAVGAGLVISLQNFLATSGLPVTTVVGVIFVVCVLAFRRGIVGEFNAFLGRRRH
ncbi:branched-chain amino acid ABC transporter permease [Zavarzinia compransoris]|uniref:Branched-chain amino acid ABC transporter permease n=1 Tax=Zavarzinia compransoris TaxID=1264899 RepID=A0A317EBA7_9PROT|nr:branched-chain amino acid ABC transporter permease [Zavarzinia compransoris]PWR23506.1 branched-chain amino acid ABC transporter permease [Zavarzinia compransoris]TDP47717.1 amino acid/amide ABC transporter membrane protein 2 (HAAT family) [Zavarzinia compransoris]